jgi:hypothetical protein
MVIVLVIALLGAAGVGVWFMMRRRSADDRE